jgi:hypothetical protein
MAIRSDNGFATWMQTYHSLLWYLSDTAIKYDHINKNLAESFNNKVKEFKYMHLHDMVDQIRIMIMCLWELRRIGDVMQGDKLSSVVHHGVNRSKNLTHLSVDKSSLWLLIRLKRIYHF